MDMQYLAAQHWRPAVEAGDLGLWDLRPRLETVHHSPSWKQRLGFADPHAADSTHFWRCRVHPDDLTPMLEAMRAHLRGATPHYQAVFRLRSNGSGYRVLQSRGRVVDRADDGQALRIVGTMLDLTDRPATPQAGLPEGPRGATAGQAIDLPLHVLVTPDAPHPPALDSERERLLGLLQDLLAESMAQLAALRRA